MEYEDQEQPSRDPRLSAVMLIITGLVSLFVALEHDRLNDLVVPVVIVVAFAQALACLIQSRDISGTFYFAFGVIPAAAAYRSWDNGMRAVVAGGLFATALLVVWVRRSQYSKIEDAELKISTLHSRIDEVVNQDDFSGQTPLELNASVARNLRDEMARVEASLHNAVEGAVSPLQASVQTLGHRVDALAAETRLPAPTAEPLAREVHAEARPVAEAAAKSLLLTAPELRPDVQRLQCALERQGFFFGESVLQECARVLAAGKKPLVLAGPTGNGKTTLGRHLPLLFWETNDPALHLTEFEPRMDSTVADVMGFQLVRDGNVVPQLGAFTKALLECVQRGGQHWLLIDALNQADVLETFGPLLELARKTSKGARFQPPGADQSIAVPKSFRVICTMNDADERHLFPLPPAALRRMEIVRIETPERENEKRALANYYQRNFGPALETAGLRPAAVNGAEEELENLLTALGELRAIGQRHGAETMRLGMADSLDILEKACGHIVATHGAVRNPFDLALRAALNQRLRSCQPAAALKSLADNAYFRSAHPEICCEASLEWTRRVTAFEV